MAGHPSAIQKLIDHFARLPGLGPKTAERLVFYLLYQPQDQLTQFADSLQHLRDTIKQCSVCNNFSQTNPCEICNNPKRTRAVICVVAKPQDLVALEKIGDYTGVYHVLGGTIDPLEGILPEQLNIKNLLNRVTTTETQEVILALNLDMSGETTTLYLTKLLKNSKNIKITRLARGLPMGSDLEYADEVTLSSALKDRREI